MGAYKKLFILVLIILAILYIYGCQDNTQAMVLDIGSAPHGSFDHQ